MSKQVVIVSSYDCINLEKQINSKLKELELHDYIVETLYVIPCHNQRLIAIIGYENED